MKMKRQVLVCALSVVSVLACSGRNVDVGSNDAANGGSGGTDTESTGGSVGQGGSGSASAGTFTSTAAGAHANDGGAGAVPPEVPPLLPWPDPSACEASEPTASNPMAGEWHGYVQGGDSTFKVVFGEGPDGPCGTITWGDAEPPEPATDPNAEYLEAGLSYKNPRRVDGFAYTLLDIKLDGPRLRFTSSVVQAYESWCALQTPEWVPSLDLYSCGPNVDARVTDGHCFQADDTEVNCVRLGTCNSLAPPCVCDAERCQASDAVPGEQFDLRLDGDAASGNGATVFMDRE